MPSDSMTPDQRNPHYLCPNCGHRFEVPAAKPPCPRCGTRCHEGVNNYMPVITKQRIDVENRAFERWFAQVDLDIQFHRDKQRYHYTTTQLAWAAWQARAAKERTLEAVQQWSINCECGCDACVELIETLGCSHD